MKHLLLTNDDGIHAEGLVRLIQTLKPHYHLTIVAPSEERSAAGLSITVRTPLEVKKVDLGQDVKAYSVTGTPTDCIKLALSGGILQTTPDLIVSGINPGSNAGRNLLYSGTVGGVIEGALREIPGVALSMKSFSAPNFAPALPTTLAIISYLLGHPLPSGTFLNVNFPSHAPFQGVKWTKQGRGVWREAPSTPHDLSLGTASFLLGKKEHLPEEEESDTYFLDKGFVTLVPVKIDELTNHQILDERRERFFELFNNSPLQ